MTYSLWSRSDFSVPVLRGVDLQSGNHKGSGRRSHKKVSSQSAGRSVGARTLDTQGSSSVARCSWEHIFLVSRSAADGQHCFPSFRADSSKVSVRWAYWVQLGSSPQCTESTATLKELLLLMLIQSVRGWSRISYRCLRAVTPRKASWLTVSFRVRRR